MLRSTLSTSISHVRPWDEIQVSERVFTDDGNIPNSGLPALIYHQVLKLRGAETASHWEEIFQAHTWENVWRNGIYSYHHYHSTAHEVLAVYSGNALVRLGGESGEDFAVKSGDVLILPAGVGHCNQRSSRDFAVVGAYPRDQEWDLCRGRTGERPAADAAIRQVTHPLQDPVYGAAGPLLEIWSGADI
jgi:uncharacterized protein YjlB